MLHVLTLPDCDRAGRIGEFYGNPKSCTFAELLAPRADPALRAVLVGMLRVLPPTRGRGLAPQEARSARAFLSRLLKSLTTPM